MSKRQSVSQEASAKSGKLKVLVGEPWDEQDRIQIGDPVETTSTRDRVLVAFAVLFGGLLVAFASHAMATGNLEMVKEVWSVVKIGLAAIIGWAAGRPVLRAVVQMLKEHDNE